MLSMMAHSNERLKRLKGAAYDKEVRELLDTSRVIFRSIKGANASQYHLTGQGLVPIDS